MIFETIYYAALTESCEIACELYKSYAATARKDGFVVVPIDYQSRPIVHKSTIVKYDGIINESKHNNAYHRPKFTTEWIVEPIYQSFVLAGMPNPNKLPILPKTAGAYSTFGGSPMSEGKFQFDMRNDEADYVNSRNDKFIDSLSDTQLNALNLSVGGNIRNLLHREKTELSGLWEWESLREKIKTFGIRNAQLVALMPTSSTSQIMGNNECIEPYTENMYKRTTLAGDFIVVNPYLIKELTDLSLWNSDVENSIKVNNGSIQFIDCDNEKITDIKYRYRTAYEIPQSVLIDLASDRQAFVDQSQSLNLHMRPGMDLHSIVGMHFYSWARGLKTGMYYLRTRAAMTAQKFTISMKDIALASSIQENKKNAQLSLEEPSEVCLSCSS
jgi:ribonucleotide reductase alpha subunit